MEQIFHIDCNCFYAAMECLYNPAIKDKPVAVAGDPENRHGIILAKNYVAKKYRIETGEALWQAKNKCPNLICVPPNYDRYLRFSRIARQLYYEYSDQVEPYGLDECWVRVTYSPNCNGNPIAIAEEIRKRMREEVGLEKREKVVDELRARFGHFIIGRASLMAGDELSHFHPKGDHTIHPMAYFR